MYQLLDSSFVGLIASVFNANSSSKEQTVQLTAFQAEPGHVGQLQGVSSAELEGLDEHMQAALAASAAGEVLCCVDGGLLGVLAAAHSCFVCISFEC
jgi:hypothetical protein